MQHLEYITHLQKYMDLYGENSIFSNSMDDNQREAHILTCLELDTVIPMLEGLYSPERPGKTRRDPVCMLRSLLLMVLKKERSITKWVDTTRSFGGFFGVLAGFEADSTPGVGTYYDFMKRIIDGPYAPLYPDQIRRSEYNAEKHKRNLPDERSAKKDDRDPKQTKSEKLANELLSDADKARADDFKKTLEDFLFFLAIKPSMEAGIINGLDALIVTGDGSIMETGASRFGTPTCECRTQGIYKCDHDRFFTSPTAELCYDHHHDCFVFGDRYYHLIVTQNKHDFPIHTHMPGGNESDYTLSLTSIDRTLKMFNENEVTMKINIFCGDGHHDSYAHYDYLDEKDILPVIPLTGKSKSVVSHLPDNKDVRLNENAIPLCPAGLPMRHHMYNRKRKTHIFVCPVKRQTHKNGEAVYITRIEECPRKQDCKPESNLGPFVYIKLESDPRLFPPIQRESKQSQEIKNLRSGSERVNSYIDSYNIDNAHRNADYSLIHLTLANIAIHADIQYNEFLKSVSPKEKNSKNLLKPLSSINVAAAKQNIRDGPDKTSGGPLPAE